MNPLVYAINEINHQIPYELLHAGMMIDEQEQTASMTSLDDKILRKVLKKRVLIDANIVGGVEMIIPLVNIAPSFYEYAYTLYYIPPETTRNREIISALNLTFMPSIGQFGQSTSYHGAINGYNTHMGPGMGGQNPLMGAADRIGNAAASAGVMTNAHLEIVGYNTILVYAHYRTLSNFGIRVVLENDSNLNNLQPRSYKSFSLMCVLATKAYLYNKLIIAINSGYLSGGQDLGMFKSILESYQSAEEEYRTYIKEVWGATAYMNDTQRYNRLLGSMISPSL